ncbi:cell cycle protein [Segetibacter sp. 3557_3]|nr:cell cycle protein [Segetibacter sp. 3557_3]
MGLTANESGNRNIERVFLALITVVMAFSFFQLFKVLEKDFSDVPRRLRDGSIMNLNADRPGERMRSLLTRGFYFQDQKDIALISAAVERGSAASGEDIDNIGELNKSRYNIPAEQAFASGGESFKKRVTVSRLVLGFSESDAEMFEKEKRNPIQVPASQSIGLGQGRISGTVGEATSVGVSGVLVRLQLVVPPDSVYTDLASEIENKKVEFRNGIRRLYLVDSVGKRTLESFTAYARTDAQGKFSFNGLPLDKSFEVLPLRPGYQYGSSQGVQQLKQEMVMSFTQAPQTLRLFSGRDFSNLKKEKAFIVRTPEEVTRWFWIIVATFFGSFFLLHILLSYRFRSADQMLLPVLMLLTGFSFITLFSLQDPLRDRFLAKNTLTYFAAGMGGILILLLFDLKKFTTDSGLYRLFVFKSDRRAANGWPWAIVAVSLLALTIFFGTGPEGSGVKVNLLGFQPSEIVKFVVIIFLAGYFSTNEKFISEYASWHKRWSFFGFALVAIVSTILLFLILGDLGPAMVCCFTFIILFSFSRGDFFPMAGAVVLYIACNWLLDNVWLATGVTLGLTWLYMLVKKKRLSESAMMALVIMAGFMLLDQVPYLDQLFPGPVQRLVDRKAIWQNAWNNEVFGGDQVANGMWAMSAGGTTGQGIGEGFAKTIPEAHTDMILPSIGEEFGLAGILCIFILFLIFLHRAIIIGRQTGRPFLFYACAGIGIGTFVQFLLIAGGSTGALPLSGVALPFISYGGSSLLSNMMAAGILLSASHIHGSPAQMKFIMRQQDRNLMPALVAALVAIVLLSVNIGRYLLNNDRWVVEPALVADRSGSRMFSYNPRISILINRLQAGNLLDRKGKILATSKPEMIASQQDSLLALGISKPELEALSHKRLERYYPFGDQMFFWTGDANTGVFNGSPNGYFAEYEHDAELRGFPTPVTKFQVSASRFRHDRFLPRTTREMTVVRRDYSALTPLLLAGINSPEVMAFKQKNRDVQLTMDAALQTSLQRLISLDDSLKLKRTSIVIMEDRTGDVLASAAYPLPPINNWDMLTLSESQLNKLPGWNVNSDIGFTLATQPGSTAKLVTTLAAFNKLGDAAANKVIPISRGELIRVKGFEPDEAGNIGIERALVRSNNSFFIKLANDEHLEEEMGTLYMKAGMFLHGVGGYYYNYEQNNTAQQERWRNTWRKTEFALSKRIYNPNNIRRTRGRGISGMSWGQGELVATPASVARLAAGIANNGTLMPNRYVQNVSGTPTPILAGIPIVKQPRYAEIVKGYMIKQSIGKVHRLGISVAGKTGTPERILRSEVINDGWYVFFAPKANGPGHIVTCVRIENAKGSSEAVKYAGLYVIPELMKRGYIKGFPIPGAKTPKQIPTDAALGAVLERAGPDTVR